MEQRKGVILKNLLSYDAVYCGSLEPSRRRKEIRLKRWYLPTRHHIPEDRNLQTHCHDNLKLYVWVHFVSFFL
jgi:hypothetical protein